MIEQCAMSDGTQAVEMGRISQCIARMRTVLEAEVVEENLKDEMASMVVGIESELARVGGGTPVDPLDMIDATERETYRQVFSLIYECSANWIAAKSLVDKIIQRLAA